MSVAVKAIHFHQNLIEGLLAFVVTSTQTGAALPAHSVNLIYKKDGGGRLFSGVKGITSPGSSYAYEHLHKFRSRQVKKWHPRLSRYRSGQQGLTSSRRAHKKDASGNFGSHIKIFLGSLEKADYFLEFLFGLFQPSHVPEADLFFEIGE